MDNKYIKQSTYSRQYIIVILTFVALILSWHGLSRYSNFTSQQHMLMNQSVGGAASEISAILAQQQYAVNVFTKENMELIQYLAKNPEDENKMEQLKEHAAVHFPEYFAITIADPKGIPLIGNYDLMVNELCQRAIHEFILGGYNYNIFIHPHVEAYHFDIMTPWQYQNIKKDNTEKGIFFISIKPALFSRILKNTELKNHHLMLIKKDSNGLIEVTSEGPRIDAKKLNEKYFLNQQIDNQIGYSISIPGTQWELIDIPDHNLFSEKRNTIILQTILIFITIFIISYIFFKLIRKEENLRYISTQHLEQTTIQLERALKFSNIATWEYNLSTKSFSWSQQALALFSLSAPETYEQYKNIIHPDFLEDFQSFIKKCIDKNSAQHFEHKIINQNYETWLEITGSLKKNGDACTVKLHGLIQNITDRKIAEKKHIEFELKQKDTLLREVHHRIKNNLQGVMSLLQNHKEKGDINKDILDHAITQLYSVSLIHGINGDNPENEIEISSLVNKISATAFNVTDSVYKPCYSLAKRHVIKTIDNNTVAIALIINELIFNAIKHTPKKRMNEITINIITLIDDVVIEIQNPGNALPNNFDFKKRIGLGTGLTLTCSLLPKHGADIIIKQTEHGIVSHLILRPPILEITNENTTYNQNKYA